MIELAEHIEALLLDNDCVIIPEFGGFVTHYSSAVHVSEENLFIPPTRSVGFNPQLRINDGVLVQSYMAAYNTSFADATRIVEKQVSQIIALLHEDGKVCLEHVGEICYNIYGDYKFTPCNNEITTPSLYGLEAFEMLELSALQSQEKPSEPVILEKKKKTYEISVNKNFLRNAVAVAALFVLFFAFSTPVENTFVEKQNYAQLLPEELFEQIANKSVAVTLIPTQGNAMQKKQQKPTQKVASNHSATSKPIVVREIKVAKAVVAPATVETKQAVPVKTKQAAAPSVNQSFHLIAAASISVKDAEAMASQLKAKGFPQAQVLTGNNKVRVSICSFNNRDEATKQMIELRKNETYKEVWLLAN